MNKRLKIICVLFTVTYLFLIGQSLISDMIPSIVSGIKEGYKISETNKSMNILHFHTLPLEGSFSYPSSMTNLKSGEPLDTEMRQFYVRMYDIKNIPFSLNIALGVQVFLSFCLLFIIIYIPILSFRVVRSISKNEIFDGKNIKRIRRIGYLILICFGITAFTTYASTLLAKEVINLENYKIVFRLNDDIMLMLFGFVVLLFAEILKISVSIKEENDLTV